MPAELYVVKPIKYKEKSPESPQPAAVAETAQDFQKVLEQAAQPSFLPQPLKPSSPEAKQQAQMVASLARLELMNLNTILLSAFTGGGPDLGAGPSLGLGSGLAGLLQLWQLLTPPGQAPEGGQNSVAGTAKTEAKPGPEKEKKPEEPQETGPAQEDLWGLKPPGGFVDGLIEKTAAVLGLDPDLIRAVVKTESNFNPKAVSHAGAMGLMQLMPGTARDLGVEDPFDPEENISGGARYLRMMLDRYAGDVDSALAAYNWGPGNLERNLGSGYMPMETRSYIRIVNQYYRQFKAGKGA
ncbi:MAG: lytic transglycosylase domain-containing protein [Thermodesulfobacteriota bacterium]